MTLKRPQSSPSHLSRTKPVRELGNFVPAAELFAQARNQRRPDSAVIDPNKAPVRPSGSPRSKRLQPKRAPSPPKTPVPQRSGASSRAETFQMGPGMYITKSQDKISVTFKTEIADSDTPPARKTPVDNLKDRLRDLEYQVSMLQIENEELKAELESERTEHRFTKKSMADELHRQLQQLKESHLDALKDLKRELSYQLDEQNRRHQYQMEKTEQEFQNVLDQKDTKIEMIESAFEAYKQNIAGEVKKKIQKLETDLKEEAASDKAKSLKDLQEKLDLERESEVEKLHARYKMELKLMAQEKEREKKELLRSFEEATDDLAKFRNALEDLDILKAAHENAKIEIRALKKEITNKNMENRDLKFKISDFEANFAKKVEQVEEKFWFKSEAMMKENTELKRRYNEKCLELFSEKANQESWIREKGVSAVETMATLVGARVKAGVQVNASNLTLEGVVREEYWRPLSAPLTSDEQDYAQLCAGVHQPDIVPVGFDNLTQSDTEKLAFMGDLSQVSFSRPRTARSSRKKRPLSKSRPKSSYAAVGF